MVKQEEANPVVENSEEVKEQIETMAGSLTRLAPVCLSTISSQYSVTFKESKFLTFEFADPLAQAILDGSVSDSDLELGGLAIKEVQNDMPFVLSYIITHDPRGVGFGSIIFQIAG